MISALRLINFKCFQDIQIATAPLTLLCGMNGMGKSSVIQALLILRQSYQAGDLLQGRLALAGELTGHRYRSRRTF
jgi:predicted ATPase